MSANDDDYLSDKFLAAPSTSSSAPRTYRQLRQEAQKRSQLKHERNKPKSRRQLELESRESGLSKSLFERAQDEEASGIGSGNKALSIMMKMGFKPGHSLGRTGGHDQPAESPSVVESTDDLSPATRQGDSPPPKAHTIHKTEPLPLQEWAGSYLRSRQAPFRLKLPCRQEGHWSREAGTFPKLCRATG
jgi:hypothetical protein